MFFRFELYEQCVNSFYPPSRPPGELGSSISSEQYKVELPLCTLHVKDLKVIPPFSFYGNSLKMFLRLLPSVQL